MVTPNQHHMYSVDDQLFVDFLQQILHEETDGCLSLLAFC